MSTFWIIKNNKLSKEKQAMYGSTVSVFHEPRIMTTPILCTSGPKTPPKTHVKQKLEYDTRNKIVNQRKLGKLVLDDRLKIHSEGADRRVGTPTKSHIQRYLLNCSKEAVIQTYLENVFPSTTIFFHFKSTL